jgi:hypothetical protein
VTQGIGNCALEWYKLLAQSVYKCQENLVAGILDEIFRLRTNGNGYVQQEWDHILLKRDLARLLAEKSIQEVSCPPRKKDEWPAEIARTRFRDLQTGDTYEYTGPWDRGVPRFYRVTPDQPDS